MRLGRKVIIYKLKGLNYINRELIFSSIFSDLDILKSNSGIKGEYYYKGFSIIITNKGMLVHSDADINSTSEAQILRDQFLKNYKDPYLLTETFLNFRQNKYG